MIQKWNVASLVCLRWMALPDKEYIALLPLEDETVLLYEYKENEDGIELLNIESDDDFEKVSNTFYDLFDDEDE